MAAQSYNAAVDMVDRNVAEGREAKTAFIDPARRLSYGALAERVARVGPMLARLGLQREDRVAMIMLDTVDFPVLFWGAIRAGIIPIPLNTLLPVEQFHYILEDSRAKALFVSPPFLQAGETAMTGLPLRTLAIAGDAPAQYPNFGQLLDAESAAAPADTSGDEVAFWLYSSGSTGMPKGVRHVHSSPMATARLYGQGVLGITENDVCFSAGKLYHAYGLGNGMSFPMSVGATTALLPDRPTPGAIFEVLRREQPTLFFGAPTLYAMMLADPACTPENGSKRLRWCVSAAEALPEHVGTEWKKRFGVDILDGIGSTEMLHIFISNQPDQLRYGTTGVAVPGYDLRIVDDKGADVPDGELGELLVRGPTAAEGYWNQREKTRRTFEGEWTRTGDIYVRDADGMYRYCGRNDDMFKVSGLWVSPFDVESALITHPSVLEAAVVAKEDGDGLLRPKAYITLKDSANASDTDALREGLKEHVKQQIGMWKYPRWIEIVDSLPKTATGKIQRFKLRD
ncbi:MAG: benzoate-CoA ligase family protein [Alphaproteobacteria bacterium]|nr:MAG: benzoate-CoA ligase family protein [Alphaproteobacteria bacterium]